MQETHGNRFRAILGGGKMCIFSNSQENKAVLFPICFSMPENPCKIKGVENYGIIFCPLLPSFALKRKAKEVPNKVIPSVASYPPHHTDAVLSVSPFHRFKRFTRFTP
jgi:hypothetical protein